LRLIIPVITNSAEPNVELKGARTDAPVLRHLSGQFVRHARAARRPPAINGKSLSVN